MLWKVFVFGFLALIGADVLGCLLNGGRIVATTSKGKVLRFRHFTRHHTVGNFFRAVCIGAVVGLAHYWPRAVKSPALGCVFFIVMILLLLVVTVWTVTRLSRWSEAFWYVVLVTAIIFAAQAAVSVMSLWWESRALTWGFFVGPWILFALLVGFTAFVLAMRYHSSTGAIVWRIVAIILVIATVASVVVISVKGNTIVGLPAKDSTAQHASAGASSSAQVNYWGHFYNDDVQKDDDADNDFNFGPNPYKKGMSAKEADREFRNRTLTDVAKGVADMCWVDKHCATRYMGDQFYDEYAGHDDAAMNAAKDVYVEDEVLYKDTMTAFFAYLDTATVEIREIENTLEDQMYMIPSRMSTRGIPDVAVFESDHQEGHYLVYTFTIKGQIVEVPFRIECGFQPTNVTEYLDVEVQERPAIISSGSTGGSNTGGGNTPSNPSSPTEPSRPESPTEPSKKYNKDKGLSDNSGVNDNPGEGPNTNNGVGAQNSAEDQKQNSDHQKIIENYGKKMEEKEGINSSQKTGGDDSTPSTKTPPGTSVDNKGAEADNPSSQGPYESELPGGSGSGEQHWDGSGI